MGKNRSGSEDETPRPASGLANNVAEQASAFSKFFDNISIIELGTVAALGYATYKLYRDHNDTIAAACTGGAGLMMAALAFENKGEFSGQSLGEASFKLSNLGPQEYMFIGALGWATYRSWFEHNDRALTAIVGAALAVTLFLAPILVSFFSSAD